MYYSRADGAYVACTGDEDKNFAPATFYDQVAEDPRMGAVPQEAPRMQPPVPEGPGEGLGGLQALPAFGTGVVPPGFGFGMPPVQLMAPSLAFGQNNAITMQPMMQPMLQPVDMMPMGQSGFAHPFRGRGQHRSKSPAARARSKERQKHFHEKQRANSLPPPARDVRLVNDVPAFKPTPKELLPTKRAVVRERAFQKPVGPTPFNRNTARDVRPPPVKQPDPEPRMQLSSDKEILEARARIHQEAVKSRKEREKERVEQREAAQRRMKEQAARARSQPMRAKASGPGKRKPAARSLCIPGHSAV